MRNLLAIRQAAVKKPVTTKTFPQTNTADHSLTNIRQVAETRADKNNQDSAKVLNVTLPSGAKKQVSVSKKALVKQQTQVAAAKRAELVKLQTEIDQKLVQAKAAGEGVVAEARLNAVAVINNANKQLNDAEQLKKELANKLAVAETKVEQYQVATNTTLAKGQALSALQRLVSKDKAEISRKEAEIDKKLALTTNLLIDMVALISVTIEKATQATKFAGEVKSDWQGQLEKLATLAQSVLETQAQNEAKGGYLNKVAEQQQQKEDIIKEQRVQLQMAADEIRKKQNG